MPHASISPTWQHKLQPLLIMLLLLLIGISSWLFEPSYALLTTFALLIFTLWIWVIWGFKRMKRKITHALSELEELIVAFEGGDTSRRMNAEEYAGDWQKIMLLVNRLLTSVQAGHRDLQGQSWIKTGLNDLSSLSRGEFSLPDFAKQAISFLAHYTQSQMGVFYARNPTDGALHLVGSFAYEHRRGVSGRIELGEGLIGQVALEKQAISVKQLPADYSRIQSGMGDSVPHEVMIVPLVFKDTMYGVIELASLTEFNPLCMDFLNNAADDLGAVLSTFEINHRNKVLVKQSQEHAVLLQRQQEEVKKYNEDLRAQAHILTDNEIKLKEQQAELERANAELQEYNHQLEIKSTEILLKNADLEKAKSELLESAREISKVSAFNSEIVANISHEIRTPLNALLGLIQVLEVSPLDPNQKSMLNQMRSASHLLLGHVNDILDFSSMESGRIKLEPQPFRLNVLLGQLQGLMNQATEAQGLRLTLKAPEEDGTCLIGDCDRLAQVLMNLFNNAVKFTQEGMVKVEVEALERSASQRLMRFAIIDTGIGIAADKISTLFRPFVQADTSNRRSYGGTGLGLSICKKLIELMGGQIGVESQLGMGSTFWFEIPFSVATTANRAETSPQKTTARPVRADLSGRHILVVDDSEMNRFTIDRILQTQQVQTTLAENGQEAVNLLKYHPQHFDAILMDIQMPVMDGLQAIHAIREELKLHQLPILACSASVKEEEQNKALSVGADDFICKPIEVGDLVHKFSRLMPPRSSDTETAHASSAHTSTVEPHPHAAWPHIPGIETGFVLEQLNGDLAFFVTLLQMLKNELSKTLTHLPEQLGMEQDGARMLHKLRGAAGTVGATLLANSTRPLEEAIKTQSPTLPALLAVFQSEAHTLLQAIDGYLAEQEASKAD